MVFKALADKKILGLSFGFAVFFFGFNGAEQFFAVYYNQLGIGRMALTALSIIYFAVIPGSLFAPWIVGRLGLKWAMGSSGIIYAAFVFALITKSPSVVYPLAALLGFFAALLGVARGTYLLKLAGNGRGFSYGEALGAQDSLRSVGSTLGVVGVGLVSQVLPLPAVFIGLGFVILLASLLFFKLPSLQGEARAIPFNRLVKVLNRSDFWLMAPLFFAGSFMLGISISTLPLILKGYGLVVVGFVTSIFSFGPILLSVTLGKISDRNQGADRKKMLLLALLAGAAAAVLLAAAGPLWTTIIATLLVTGLFSAVNSAGGGLIGEVFAESDWEAAQGLLGIFGTLGVIVPLVSEAAIPREETLRLVALACFVAFAGLVFLRGRKLPVVK